MTSHLLSLFDWLKTSHLASAHLRATQGLNTRRCSIMEAILEAARHARPIPSGCMRPSQRTHVPQRTQTNTPLKHFKEQLYLLGYLILTRGKSLIKKWNCCYCYFNMSEQRELVHYKFIDFCFIIDYKWSGTQTETIVVRSIIFFRVR